MKAKTTITRDKALSLARRMSYQKKIKLLKLHKWISTGHWDNWFHPISHWNYSLFYAVVDILEYGD